MSDIGDFFVDISVHPIKQEKSVDESVRKKDQISKSIDGGKKLNLLRKIEKNCFRVQIFQNKIGCSKLKVK